MFHESNFRPTADIFLDSNLTETEETSGEKGGFLWCPEKD